MSYQKAIEAAGAEVHEFEVFGSYQGDWWAKVTYKGQTGWVKGSYGSCSGCDSFEADFGYQDHTCGGVPDYEPLEKGFRAHCATCQDLKKRYIAFGESYLEEILTQEQAIAKASEDLDWDMGAKEMVGFLQSHFIDKEAPHAQ